MDKKCIGVIFGGRSGEHEVSLKSARSVIEGLDPARYSVVPVGISKTGAWVTGEDVMGRLMAAADPELLGMDSHGAGSPDQAVAGELVPPKTLFSGIDVVFPVLHGPFGEDGTLQGFLDLIQVPYVGCGVAASAVCMDKILFKRVMLAEKIPSVAYIEVFRDELDREFDRIRARVQTELGWPVFCKPANMGSSVGITKCGTGDALREGLKIAARYDRRIIVETAVPHAREIEVSVLGNDDPRTSVPGEIVPSREFYDYAAKYIDAGESASDLRIPAPLAPETERICREMAVRAYRAVDGAGMARVDFLLNDETGAVFLNEINTIPGFTSISMYAKLWRAIGLDYPRLLDRLIDLAVARFDDRNRNQVAFGEL